VSEKVEVLGLRELRRNLRQMDRKLPREIRKAGNKAADIVVRHARPRVPVRTGRAAASVRVASTQSAVGVAGGSARVPYYAWLDFGGTINRHTGHPTRRPFIKRGRYIWAAFGDHRQQVLDAYQDALGDAARDAELDVT
jgi:hypothetical protein